MCISLCWWCRQLILVYLLPVNPSTGLDNITKTLAQKVKKFDAVWCRCPKFSLQRKKNAQINGRISRSRQVLFPTIHQVIPTFVLHVPNFKILSAEFKRNVWRKKSLLCTLFTYYICKDYNKGKRRFGKSTGLNLSGLNLLSVSGNMN